MVSTWNDNTCAGIHKTCDCFNKQKKEKKSFIRKEYGPKKNGWQTRMGESRKTR